jgi:2-methylaconitate isomerase
MGGELPEQLEANTDVLGQLDAIRLQGSVLMGIASMIEAAREMSTVPYFSFVSPAADAVGLSGESMSAGDIDLTVRLISNGQPHRALPLTGSLCTAVAARIAGIVVAGALSPAAGDGRHHRSYEIGR